jgi:hypothetical protein
MKSPLQLIEEALRRPVPYEGLFSREPAPYAIREIDPQMAQDHKSDEDAKGLYPPLRRGDRGRDQPDVR